MSTVKLLRDYPTFGRVSTWNEWQDATVKSIPDYILPWFISNMVGFAILWIAIPYPILGRKIWGFLLVVASAVNTYQMLTNQYGYLEFGVVSIIQDIQKLTYIYVCVHENDLISFISIIACTAGHTPIARFHILYILFLSCTLRSTDCTMSVSYWTCFDVQSDNVVTKGKSHRGNNFLFRNIIPWNGKCLSFQSCVCIDDDDLLAKANKVQICLIQLELNYSNVCFNLIKKNNFLKNMKLLLYYKYEFHKLF